MRVLLIVICLAMAATAPSPTNAADPQDYFLPPEGRIIQTPPLTWQEREMREKAIEADMSKLKQKWERVQRLSQQEFINWIASQRTVMGASIFSDVEIAGSVLQLWAANSNTMEANLQWCADLADAFLVWCRCDATTTVGIDYRYRTLGRHVFHQIRFDPSAGRSVIGR